MYSLLLFASQVADGAMVSNDVTPEHWPETQALNCVVLVPPAWMPWHPNFSQIALNRQGCQQLRDYAVSGYADAVLRYVEVMAPQLLKEPHAMSLALALVEFGSEHYLRFLPLILEGHVARLQTVTCDVETGQHPVALQDQEKCYCKALSSCISGKPSMLHPPLSALDRKRVDV